MAPGKLACDLGDESCKLLFDFGMDVKDSSYTGGAASELLVSLTLFAMALCYDIADVFVVGFSSEPDWTSAFIDFISWNDRQLTFEIYGLYSGTRRNLNYLRFRRLLVHA